MQFLRTKVFRTVFVSSVSLIQHSFYYFEWIKTAFLMDLRQHVDKFSRLAWQAAMFD